MGPTMAPGNRVLEAIHALYYLPENFKLILAGNKHADQSFFNEVLTLVRHDGLDHRVSFDTNADSAQAVILPNIGKSRAMNAITGDSPEALASAILNIART